MPTYTERNDNRFFWTARQLGHAVHVRQHSKTRMKAKWTCSCGDSGKYQATTFARNSARQHAYTVIEEHRGTSDA